LKPYASVAELLAASLDDRFERPWLNMNRRANRVSLAVFWERIQGELANLPETNGYHFGKARKWSQDKDYFGEEFSFLFKGGSVVYCQTATTSKLRAVSCVEFEKVYSVWEGYRRGEIPRSRITEALGVQNSSWVIPLLKEYEHLMYPITL